MSTIERDLWPTDIDEVDLVAPVAILKGQAVRLANHTRGVVTAEVISTGSGERFEHLFYVRARALHYESLLFTVSHDVEMYPLTVLFDGLARGQAIVASEEEFAAVLTEVFSSPRTTRLIKSLMAQIES